jgi:hypothetical protein
MRERVMVALGRVESVRASFFRCPSYLRAYRSDGVEGLRIRSVRSFPAPPGRHVRS